MKKEPCSGSDIFQERVVVGSCQIELSAQAQATLNSGNDTSVVDTWLVVGGGARQGTIHIKLSAKNREKPNAKGSNPFTYPDSTAESSETGLGGTLMVEVDHGEQIRSGIARKMVATYSVLLELTSSGGEAVVTRKMEKEKDKIVTWKERVQLNVKPCVDFATPNRPNRCLLPCFCCAQYRLCCCLAGIQLRDSKFEHLGARARPCRRAVYNCFAFAQSV